MGEDMNGSSVLRIGYLTSEYPMISCTFILREIAILRELGFEIKTVSINRPKVNFEIEEEKKTYYIKEQGVFGALRSCISRFIKGPIKFLSGLKLACSLGIRSSFFYHLFYFLEALLVADWAEKNHLSHIHVHFMNSSSTVALLVKELTSITISFTVHGPDSFKNCDNNFFREKVHAAKFVVCISDYAKSQVMNLVPYEDWEKLHVVRLGVNLDLFKPAAEEADSKCIKLLCVGRLTPAKGQHLIIDALAELKKENQDFQMTFVGGGPDFDSLHQLAKSKGLEDFIFFTGPLSEEETRKQFRQSDIFLLPSFSEGLPVVLMEAMATGLPCVTTCIAGIPELIECGKNGVLISPGSAEAILQGLNDLMFDTNLRDSIGKTARETIARRYAIEKNTGKLADLFISQILGDSFRSVGKNKIRTGSLHR